MSGARAEDKRLRATLVVLASLLLEVYWLKFRVVPDFVRLYREFGGELPKITTFVFGWTPYAIALGLAPLALVLGLRGADGDRRSGAAGLVLAGALLLGLGVGVIWALYRPIQAVSGAVQ